MSSTSRDSGFPDTKQKWTNFGTTTASTATNWILLNAINTGVNTDQRETNVIRQYYVKIRGIVEFIPTTGLTGFIQPPVVLLSVARDKIPTLAGSPPTYFLTDVAPPINDDSLFVGAGDTQNFNHFWRNPNTAIQFHVYENRRFEYPCNSIGYLFDAASNNYSYKRHYFSMEIPLHEVETQFANSGVTGPTINAIWLAFRLSQTQFLTVVQSTVQFCACLGFKDVQNTTK